VSEENVKIVRSISIFAGLERGDFSSADWADTNIEFERAGDLTGGRCTGSAGMAEGWRDWLRAWEDVRIAEVEEYREIDHERVLVLIRASRRGKTSGLEVGQLPLKGAALFHMRDGKVTRLVSYAPRDRAFADLGLEG
jgi:ketosteroid isomerase-like protein